MDLKASIQAMRGVPQPTSSISVPFSTSSLLPGTESKHYPDPRTAAEKYEAEKARRGYPVEETTLEGIVAQNAQSRKLKETYFPVNSAIFPAFGDDGPEDDYAPRIAGLDAPLWQEGGKKMDKKAELEAYDHQHLQLQHEQQKRELQQRLEEEEEDERLYQKIKDRKK